MRVEKAFSLAESERHIDALLTEPNLRGTGLLLTLPDPTNLPAVQEFVHLNAEGKFLDLMSSLLFCLHDCTLTPF